jgi:hypothetical protein
VLRAPGLACHSDVPIEKIADLVGHMTTIVNQTVYPHQLRPVIETGPHHCHEHDLEPPEEHRVLTSGSPLGPRRDRFSKNRGPY